MRAGSGNEENERDKCAIERIATHLIHMEVTRRGSRIVEAICFGGCLRYVDFLRTKEMRRRTPVLCGGTA